MKAYKAFNKDMTCRGFQYAEGGDYALPEGQEAKLCDQGFHACERAVDVLRHYSAGQSVVHEVEVDGVDPKRDADSKVCGSRIHIGARLNVAQLVQATFEYNKEHCTNEHTDPNQASAGYRGAASAGSFGAASAGYRGAASAGESGAASAGSFGAASAGSYGAASAGSFGAASAGESGAASAGYRGAASAGSFGAASAGESGAASAGYRGAASAGSFGAAVSRGTASVGANGIACARGNGCKVRGGLGSVLVIAEEAAESYDITVWKAVVVDGETVKANTWYQLVDNELQEAENDEGDKG